MKKTLYVLIALCSCLASCKKDTTPTSGVNIVTGDVISLNQANFNTNEASVTLYNPATKAVTANIFSLVNNRPLGDVAQSMLMYNGAGYIVVNHSSKIEVVDMTSFKSLGTISGLGSPQYILPIGGNKAYVSDLYFNPKIIDLNAYKVLDSLSIPASTEQMVLANGNAYILQVLNFDSSYLLLVNTTSNAITATIPLGLHGANSMVKDSSGNIWVLCSPSDNTASGLVKVSTTTNAVTQTLPYPISATAYFTALTEAPDGNTLCFLGTAGVYKMTASGGQLPTTPFIAGGTHTYLGLGIDNGGSNLYVSDNSYTANDSVYSYTIANGTPVTSFLAGIAPCMFVFK